MQSTQCRGLIQTTAHWRLGDWEAWRLGDLEAWRLGGLVDRFATAFAEAMAVDEGFGGRRLPTAHCILP